MANLPTQPIECELVFDPVPAMEAEGLTFKFIDISLEKNAKFRFD